MDSRSLAELLRGKLKCPVCGLPLKESPEAYHLKDLHFGGIYSHDCNRCGFRMEFFLGFAENNVKWLRGLK